MTNANQSNAPNIKYRKDYRPSDYLINKTKLDFELEQEFVIVTSQLSIDRNSVYHAEPLTDLELDGVQLELLSIEVDGETLEQCDFTLTNQQLIIHKVKPSFCLTTRVKIYPDANTSLEGLYLSSGKFCTQCEAEGFRKITYYLDRPEIMSEFHVSIEADKSSYPLLLSNGNPVSRRDLADNRHVVHWHDPYPKPSYLFALVAGDLDCLHDKFTTMNNRKVKLQLFVDKGKLEQCRFAMDSLIEAMKWDEQRFGREYDLDLYMIVAVSDFNMGAMENKGLNIFNTAYVLASEKSATDADFQNVERVVAHEYFHNWTGNRITCRDWFQLSLKEGLTVFRDQKFSETMQSSAVERINQVKIIRSAQFAEDSGPMAHPIRPDSYIEMNNFYTVTVYNKGAEVIRMMHTLLGEQGFRKGMNYYFEQFDGQAVTCEDFIQSMEKANNLDWQQFRAWYARSGTPTLTAQIIPLGLTKDSTPTRKLTLRFAQSLQQTSPKDSAACFMIPIELGFLSINGQSLKFRVSSDQPWNDELLLTMTEQSQDFEMEIEPKENLKIDDIIPSLLRGFSAPVKLVYHYSQQQLTQLYASDPDPFNRWDAGQRLMSQLLLSSGSAISNVNLNSIAQAVERLLTDANLDNSLKALATQLPSLSSLIGEVDKVDLDDLFFKHQQLKKHLATALEDRWLSIYNLADKKGGDLSDRALKNIALSYLLFADESKYLCLAFSQRDKANNMTDEIAALQVICRSTNREFKIRKNEQIENFYHKWKEQDLVLDKWFAAQAMQDDSEVIKTVKSLLSHEKFSFTNPNKIRSLIATFAAGNITQFHSPTGVGYDFLTTQIIQLNETNPQIGARLAKEFSQWRKFDKKRQALIKDSLTQIMSISNLSNDIFEVVSKSLVVQTSAPKSSCDVESE